MRKKSKDNIDEIINETEHGEIVNSYKRLKFLGKGTFANVYEFQDMSNNQIYAAKIVSKAFLARNKVKPQFLKEINIHSELNNEYILKLHKVFEDNNFIYLLLNVCNNGNLADLINSRGKLTELEAKYYSKQLAFGLKYLNENKIIHRDIKPSNLLFDENMNLKIADFGLASKIGVKKNKSFCGTPNFLAPEIFNYKEGHGIEVDIWSFGVNLYCMLYGKPPFERNTIKDSYQAILNEEFKLDYDDIKISDEAKNLIKLCLRKDLKIRLTIDKILDHPWILDSSIPNNMNKKIFNTSYDELNLSSNKKILQSKPSIENDLEENSPKNPKKFLNKGIYERSVEEMDIEHAMTIKLKNSANDFEKQDIQDYKYIYVKKWADMSDKFGIGYILNSGAIGIFFIDGSKLYLSPYGITYNYEEKNSRKIFSLVKCPNELKKKLEILNCFKDSLKSLNKKKTNNNQKDKTQKNYNENITVLKYKKTSNSWIFKLSSGYIQSIFNDKTELHLNNYDGNFIFIDKNRNKSYYHLKETNWKNNKEILTRLKYLQKSIN